MAELFGFEIKRKLSRSVPSVIAPAQDDGSLVTQSINAGGYHSHVIDMEAIVKNENDLIRRYRETSLYADCDAAIEDIVNEAIIAEPDDQAVKINLDIIFIKN